MGQGDPRGQHQGRIGQPLSRQHSINFVRPIAAPDSTPTTLETRNRRAYRNRGHAYRPPSLSSILPPRHHAARTPPISRALTPSTIHSRHPRSRGAPGGCPIRRRSAASPSHMRVKLPAHLLFLRQATVLTSPPTIPTASP